MRMLYDHVLLKEIKSKSVVEVAEKGKSYPETGEVLAVGPGDAYGYPASYPGPNMKPMTCRKGDRVYFSRDRAIRIELATGIHYVVKERDILGILEKDEVK